jgi:hypothetical protein
MERKFLERSGWVMETSSMAGVIISGVVKAE